MSSDEFPFETPPSASLNRIQIVDLPGQPLDDDVRGQRGAALAAHRALMALAAEHAGTLGLSEDDLSPATPLLTYRDVVVRDRVARAVDAGLSSDDPACRAAAEAVARRLGASLSGQHVGA